MYSLICAFFPLIVKITKIMYWLFLATQLLNLSWIEEETAGQMRKLVQHLSKILKKKLFIQIYLQIIYDLFQDGEIIHQIQSVLCHV